VRGLLQSTNEHALTLEIELLLEFSIITRCMQNPPLNDEAALHYYTIETLDQHSRQFDGDLRWISLEFTVLSSTFAVLRAFLNGCKDQQTVRWTLHPFFWLVYCIHVSIFFRFCL
jgi:hypothetical protein